MVKGRYEYVEPVIISENELAHTNYIYQKLNIVLIGDHPKENQDMRKCLSGEYVFRI
jgi:hypothetical protein